MTRPQAQPDNQIEVTVNRCPDCGTKLGTPFKIESKITEKVPEPQPVIITEYRFAHYLCPRCNKKVVGTDPGCPDQGRFGYNTIALTTLLKYKDRLPNRKIQDSLKRQFGLKISPATILDLTRRAAYAVRPEYEAILERVRAARVSVR